MFLKCGIGGNVITILLLSHCNVFAIATKINASFIACLFLQLDFSVEKKRGANVNKQFLWQNI